MDAASTVHRVLDDEPTVYDAARELARSGPEQRYKRGDQVQMPSGRIAEIRSRSDEDAFKWSDRAGERAAYRVRFLDDSTIAQFRADWLDKHCEPVVAGA